MKIIACIKQVPDSEAKVKAENGQVTWGDAPLVINPFDEYAVEGALQQKEANGGTVTALCIGPESAKEAPDYRGFCQDKEAQCRQTCGEAGVQTFTCKAGPSEGVDYRCECKKPLGKAI